MNKTLPPRPNLDHLRRQAKSLLSALASGEGDAASTLREHLPAAKGMSTEQIRAARFRLADAQSAIARKSGFAGWPHLARHVEQLRAMEGTWAFASLEVDGVAIPPAGMQYSRMLIDGDRFRMESPEANYEGIFNIDVEAQPHRIDIEFVEGPEAGNWNYGIFRINGDRLEICLDMNGKSHPAEFRTSPGSGHAFETLTRVSTTRPDSVNGGTPPAPGNPWPTNRAAAECGGSPSVSHTDGYATGDGKETAGFEYVACTTIARLQGEWTAEKLVRDGQEFPPMMCKTGRRSATKNEVKITFGGQVIIHALTRINENANPVEVDYLHVSGSLRGQTQQGIMQWQGDNVCFCMAAPNTARPADFECAAGSGRTLSVWRLSKK